MSKWKIRYEQAGTQGLRLAYRGKTPYLSPTQRFQVVSWIQSHETLTIEALRDYMERQYEVVYDSKQSYYDLLTAGGMSYHATTASNPKYAEEQVVEKREEIKKKWHSTSRR